MATPHIVLLPGDGIGPDIMACAERLLQTLVADFGLEATWTTELIGGAALDQTGQPLPKATVAACQQASAVLLGAVGGPAYDHRPRDERPETGLLRLREALGVFANLRPAKLFEPLRDASTLKPEVVTGLDVLIVRELTGGIYFGKPRGERRSEAGLREGYNTERYCEDEVERLARVAFAAAQQRRRRLCSVDKANVLESSVVWRDTMERVGEEFPDVTLTHMYVDNAAMQLVRAPTQFDVIATGNLFGDILSDEAAMLTGSIGLLPSAALNDRGQGLYEPIHGSAPDIAGQDRANPLAMLLSVAMMLRLTLNEPTLGERVESAVTQALHDGLRTADIAPPQAATVGTQAMGEAVIDRLHRQ